MDLYPDDDSQFTLGQASFQQRVAVVSFGRFDPKTYVTNSRGDQQGGNIKNPNDRDLVEIPCDGKPQLTGSKEKIFDEGGSVASGDNIAISGLNSGITMDDKYAKGTIDNHVEIKTISRLDGVSLWRLMRCVSHEIGHLLYFSHCRFFECAMSNSRSVTEAESKPIFLCPICLRKLQKVCGFNVASRYGKLKTFFSSLLSSVESRYLDESVAWLDAALDLLRDNFVTRSRFSINSLAACIG